MYVVLFVIKLVLLLCINSVTADELQLKVQTYHKPWSWTCNAKSQCVRKHNKIDEFYKKSEDTFNSYELCRLVCGKYGSIWPKPSKTTILSRNIIELNPHNIHFKFNAPTVNSQHYLRNVSNIFLRDVKRQCKENCIPPLHNYVNISIKVESGEYTLNMNTDESYYLTILTKVVKTETWSNISITSYTVFGARHALETLSQLIVPSPISLYSSNHTLYILSKAEIEDVPYYKHRGLLLDTARNYLPVDTIKRQIRAMAMSKLNVFHWHLTDSHSFPFISQSVPQLSEYGAYSSRSTYSAEEVQDIVAFGILHGVRVVLELDAPAHAGNGWQWGEAAGLGKLAVCVNEPVWRPLCIQPPCGQLNPANENIYRILGDLYGDLQAVNKNADLFHMGGDEVFFPCWNSSQEILDYLNQSGHGNTKDDFLHLWGEFQRKATAAYDVQARNTDTKFVMWSSALTQPNVITKYLNNQRYIIQTWVPSDDPLPTALLALNYTLIISTKNAWYLDHGFWGQTRYYPWRVVYDNRLPVHPAVRGGEVCMWGEYVDATTVDGKVWPRAAAAAERLWTNALAARSVDDEARFYWQRERLVRRGVKADAVIPQWCSQNDGQCQ